MSKTSVLFICPDNSLLGPLAEAYLNFRAGGLMRAFSAGIEPALRLNAHVKQLLTSVGANPEGLQPKPVDVFLMPHTIVPDRVIYLADLAPIKLPTPWKTTTSSHWWSIDTKSGEPHAFAASDDCFRRIRKAIDRLLEPPRVETPSILFNVA